MKKLALTACVISLAVMGITAACNGENEKNVEAPAAKQMDISVIAREAGSGTRDAFNELVGTLIKQDGKKKDNTAKDAITIDGTQGVMSAVAGNEYAIGYISLGSLNGSVKALDIDGFAPTKENIKAAKYPIARPFNIATKGKMNDAVKDFVNFILSADGQAVIEGNGYIRVSDGKKFQAQKLKGKIVIAGSSSVSPVMEKLKEAYTALNPEMEIEIQTNDSSSGMLAAKEGTCDIGMASRNLKPSELEVLTSQTIARDGIAVIVNKQNKVSNIALSRLRDVYTGLIRKWKDVK
ncbi:substrate-binding domain-containing protein [Fibrobacter sp.]